MRSVPSSLRTDFALVNSRDPVAGYQYSWRPWALIVALFCAQLLSTADRVVLGMLVEPIKHRFLLTDTQVSVLSGVALFVSYSLAFIPAGFLADRVSRKKLIALGVTFWTLATAACGLAASYGQMIIARICVGLGEATLPPTAHSLIATGFPPKRHALALGIFVLGGTLGASASLVIGGYLIGSVASARATELPLIGLIEPWQLAFLIVCAPGFILAPLILLLQEPPRRRSSEGYKGSNLKEIKAFYAENWRILVPHHLTVSFSNGIALVIVAWVAPFFMRVHQWPAEKIGVLVAMTMAISGLVAQIGGGVLSDRLVRYGVRGRMLMCAAVMPFAAIALALFVLSDNIVVIAIALTVATSCCYLPYGLAGAALQSIVPDGARGSVAAIFLLTSNLCATLGPTIVALLSDNVFVQVDGIRYSILWFGVLSALLCGLCSLISALQFKSLSNRTSAVPGKEDSISIVRLTREQDNMK